ncbi:MAG: tetraacyldisaccharide 4'-kinase [Geminicoccaceae bacterium]|nr:tetraacyldisaccharide 4'-kinase [Geminicoccaceae bacterium]
MREPAFWQRPGGGLPGRMLEPLARLHGQLRKLHAGWMLGRMPCAGLPVILVGGLRVGGSGKTPFVRLLRRILQERGAMPHVLIRGYGGRLRGVHGTGRACAGVGGADMDTDTRMFGDEAVLHALDGPVWVGADRVLAAARAKAEGASHAILDDGMQGYRLRPDLTFLVIDGGNPLGNGRLLPAGPLRESPSDAAARADALVIIASGAVPSFWPMAKPVFRFMRRPVCPIDLRSTPLDILSGIADPARFRRDLEVLGACIGRHVACPDHHHFRESELHSLHQQARGRAIVTTRKDWLRLDARWRERIVPVDLELVAERPGALEGWIGDRMDFAGTG